MEEHSIINGDCLEVMQGMEENSVHSIVCDPPYELTSIVKRFGKKGAAPAKPGTDGRFTRLGKGFMGRAWDGTGIGMRPEVWRECLRVAKPGAYLLAFGGTRTFHRLACAIEDAGWVLRDTLSWNYGSGFPKSHDISKALDRKAGEARPRDITLQPRSKLYGDRPWMNNPEHKFESNTPISPEAKQWNGFGTALKPAWEPVLLFQKPLEGACSEELHAITEWRRWHTKAPKESWGGKPEDEESWHASKCYKLSKQYGLEWWERETEDGKIERWIFERRWDALEPKARGRHVVIGKNKRIVLSREQYKNKQYICVAANVLKWGCGTLNIDGCRIKATDGQLAEKYASVRNAPARENSVYGKDARARSEGRLEPHSQGRWPANALFQHSLFCEKVGEHEEEGYAINRFTDGAKPFGGGAGHPYESERRGKEVVEEWRCVPECPIAILDAQSGETVTRPHGGKGERLDTQKAGWRFRRMPSTLSDRGGASRFFRCFELKENELLLERAKAILSAWNKELANTVDDDSRLSNEHAASALEAVVLKASQGAMQLSDLMGLFMNVTPMLLRWLCENVIMAILNIDEKSLPASFHIATVKSSGNLVKYVEQRKPTDTTTTIASPTNSGGSAVVITLDIMPSNTEAGEAASAARFKYCAKASREERNAGLEGMPDKVQHRTNPGGLENDPRWAPKVAKNPHPTVKPINLLRYLCRLATPPGGTVLDCFAGSGSTGCAAVLEGFQFVGIEKEREYVEIMRSRIKHWASREGCRDGVSAHPRLEKRP